jgi:glycerophosphoryl diester phosphodiesterase
MRDKMKNYKMIAHRGVHNNKNILENTLKAFRRSIIENYPIEFDIQLTKDNEIVIFHDLNLKRMTGIDGIIGEFTLEEINNFNLLNTNEKIPTLKEALELIKGKVPIYIEIKSIKYNKKICDILISILNNYKGKVYIMSFNPFIIKYLKSKKAYNYGLLISSYPNKFLLKIINPNFIAISKHIINDQYIKKLNNKYLIYIWTIKSKNELNKYNNNYFYICDNVPY